MNQDPTLLTPAAWLSRRFPPALAAVAAGALAAGLFRSYALFLPGLAGMATGGLAGWFVGRLARRDPEESYTFGFRAGLALGAAALYGAVGVLMASLRDPRTFLQPLPWIGRVLRGRAGECFFGFSGYSFQSVSGLLGGGWWLLFFLVDLLLFAALFLVSFGVGQNPDDVEGEEDGDDTCTEEPEMAPASGSGPRGGPVFLLFAGAALAVLTVPGWVRSTPGVSSPSPAPVPSEAGTALLRGRWIVDGEATILGRGEEARTFSLISPSPGELGGFSLDRSWYLVGLKPSTGGAFDGALHIPGGDTYRLSVRPAPGSDRLLFTVYWSAASGRMDFRFTARRIQDVR